MKGLLLPIFMSILTATSISPIAHATDAELMAHLCANDDPRSKKTEASAPCVDCQLKLLKGKKALSPIDMAEAKGLRTPKEAAEIKRDLAFYDFFFKHYSDMGLQGTSNLDIPPAVESRISTLGLYIKSFHSQIEEIKNKPESKQLQSLTELLDGKISTSPVALRSYAISKASWHQDELMDYQNGLKTFHDTESPLKSHIEKNIADLKTRMAALEKIVQWTPSTTFTDAEKEQLRELQKEFHSSLDRDHERIEVLEKQISESEKELAAKKAKLPDLVKKQESIASLPETERIKAYETELEPALQVLLKREPMQGCGMSIAEVLAVYGYSMDGYHLVNSALRAGGSDGQSVEPFRRELDSALSKLRRFQGTAFRFAILPSNVLKQHEAGKIITYSAFTSSSSNAHAWHGDVEFRIHSKSGHYIAPFSGHMAENEILFASDSKFKILSRDEGNPTVIVLEEVTP